MSCAAWHALQVQDELYAARRDAGRQHARQLQLDLRTAQMATAGLQLQVSMHVIFVSSSHPSVHLSVCLSVGHVYISDHEVP